MQKLLNQESREKNANKMWDKTDHNVRLMRIVYYAIREKKFIFASVKFNARAKRG